VACAGDLGKFDEQAGDRFRGLMVFGSSPGYASARNCVRVPWGFSKFTRTLGAESAARLIWQ
jgi:hypothetical protein